MNDIRQILESMCRDYNAKMFAPILEADIAAYMYHLWIAQFGNAASLHLDTRIYQKLDSKFDFVVGKLDYNVGKPCITQPELVAEMKAFPYSFSDQQHRVHYFHVIEDDLPKLQSLKNPVDSRYEILFDEDDYLRGIDMNAKSSRIERLIKRRNEVDSKIILVHFKKTAKGLEYKLA